MNEQQERSAFERWYEGHCLPGEADWFRRDPDEPSEYKHGHTSEAWAGWQAGRAALAANEKVPSRATDIATALALPGCERLREWAEIGPVQRAAVEDFAYALAANVPQTVYQLSPTDIYDFGGWLTTRKVSMQAGSSHEASQMAEAVGEYLKTYPERFAAAPASEAVMLFNGMTPHQFSLNELYEFQQATGCDTADEYLAAKAKPDAQQHPDTQDAERYRWLRQYNTVKHPQVTEAFFLGDRNLDAAIDAALGIAASKGGAE